MKRTILFVSAFFCLCIFLFSCGKEDNIGSSSLIGTWLLIEEGTETANGGYNITWSIEENNEHYTEEKFFVFTKETVMWYFITNGTRTDYTELKYEYSEGYLWFADIKTWEVILLNTNTLKIRSALNHTEVRTFKKQ